MCHVCLSFVHVQRPIADVGKLLRSQVGILCSACDVNPAVDPVETLPRALCSSGAQELIGLWLWRVRFKSVLVQMALTFSLSEFAEFLR